MKVGDLVMFPCDFEEYHIRCGLLFKIRDNPADAKDWEMKIKYGGDVPAYCKNGPRQIADVLYKGQMTTAWLRSLRKMPVHLSRR